MSQKVTDKIIEQIRNEVKKGRYKRDVANEFHLAYSTVKRYCQDIKTDTKIPRELIECIRKEVRNGNSKRQAAEKLGVSRYTVIKYTRKIQSKYISRRRSPEFIKQIRDNVKKYNSKSKTARVLDVSYGVVRWYTQDIRIGSGITLEVRDNIRKEILSGRSRHEVSQEFNVSYQTVLKLTKDIPSNHFHSNKGEHNQLGFIRGRTLDILKDLLKDGYYICNSSDIDSYHKLKQYFSMIYKVKSHGKIILFLEDKSNIAAKTLLETINKKIMSYQELKQVTNLFDTDLTKREKQRFIGKKQSKKTSKDYSSNSNSNLSNDDSLAFFYIRNYWLSSS